jgi:hypothetical protein
MVGVVAHGKKGLRHQESRLGNDRQGQIRSFSGRRGDLRELL